MVSHGAFQADQASNVHDASLISTHGISSTACVSHIVCRLLSCCPGDDGACCCLRVLQMGACCSSPQNKYEGAAQGSSPPSTSHKGKHQHHHGGNSAQKTSKVPDFGLGDSFEVCCSVPGSTC
jgi:hypothetical protein